MDLLRPFKSRSVVDVHGHILELDTTDYLGLSITRIYEYGTTRFFQRQVQPGDTALDLGAHIGYFTLLLAKLVGPTGRVIAFEPHPDNFALLKRNVQANSYTNVSLWQAAVSDRAGRVTLRVNPANSGDHRIFAPERVSP